MDWIGELNDWRVDLKDIYFLKAKPLVIEKINYK